MSAVYRKQTCYLCEMPRSPWAVIHDFSELVCRSCVNYEGPDRIEAILASARRMRGSFGIQQEGGSSGSGGQQGIKRESSAPYPVPRMGSNNREVNNTGAGLEMGPSAGALPGYLSQGAAAPAPHNQMQPISLDQIGFQRRPGQFPGHMGGQQMGGGVPMLPQKPTHMPPTVPTSMDVKPPSVRAPVPTSRPPSANSGPGSHPGQGTGPPTPGSRPDQVSSSSNGAREGQEVQPDGAPLLKCTNCRGKLEDTHFVQCPSNIAHKFCFSCCRESIIKQGNEAFCPSGDKCPLQGSIVPWAFMQEEIETILGEKSEPDKK
eukprot:GFUD01008325.1.p1 GENE.GFUD01008325.1~~GFUD01008325.1.p1  ORF type:complete len:318 (-),score=72.04 GFUD01008325.1:662-1615(-)